MPTITYNTIATRLQTYHEKHPTSGARRELARKMIDARVPDSEIPQYSDLQQPWLHLHTLWPFDIRDHRVVTAATHLWRTLLAAEDYPNQWALVFRHGIPTLPPTIERGDTLSLVAGRLPTRPWVSHKLTGKLSDNADPSFEGIKAPYIRSWAGLSLLSATSIYATAGSYDLGKPQPNPEPPELPYTQIFEAVAHAGSNRDYAAQTASITAYPVLLGDTNVRAFITRLAPLVGTTQHELLTALPSEPMATSQ